ncbi:FMN-dependent NADH-azoreductase [Staphylococcus haemolyticus]
MSAFLLNQFKANHLIVILIPLHNFNITSRLKDYIDNIMIARETFK